MLKPYIGFSRALGSPEAAILIFASNRQEAKKIGWPVASGMMVDEYIDFGIRSMKDRPHLMEQAKMLMPHVIDSPEVCPKCELWGSPPTKDSKGNLCCEDCEDDDYS